VLPATDINVTRRQSKQTTVQQPLLGNSSVDVLSPVTREHAIMEETFPVWSVSGLYNKDFSCSSCHGGRIPPP
jgi:hypothetical protein